MTGKLLHVYPQYMEHCEAIIVGNREGLELLLAAVNAALNTGLGTEQVMASDGEGYDVIVVREDADWLSEAWAARAYYSAWDSERDNDGYSFVMRAKAALAAYKAEREKA